MNRSLIWILAGVLCLLISGLGLALDGPSEDQMAATVALDLNDAIANAQAAQKEQP